MNTTVFQLLFLACRAMNPKFFFVPVMQVMAQTMLETGKFTSAVCVQNKNLFGMKMPSVRKTTAKGTSLNHAYYNSYWDSIVDYFLWLEHFELTTIEKYQSRIKNNYAEDANYYSKIQAYTAQIAKTETLIKPELLFIVAIIFFF